jgi:hypothetical protein
VDSGPKASGFRPNVRKVMGLRGSWPNNRKMKGKAPMAYPVNRPNFVFKAKERVGLSPKQVPLVSGDTGASSSTSESLPPAKGDGFPSQAGRDCIQPQASESSDLPPPKAFSSDIVPELLVGYVGKLPVSPLVVVSPNSSGLDRSKGETVALVEALESAEISPRPEMCEHVQRSFPDSMLQVESPENVWKLWRVQKYVLGRKCVSLFRGPFRIACCKLSHQKTFQRWIRGLWCRCSRWLMHGCQGY